LLDHNKVFPLSFFAQPLIHYNDDSIQRINKCCFAGSYWNNRYFKRQEMTNLLLDTAIPFGVDIYDRNLFRTNNYQEYRFPEKYSQYIKGNLSYEEMCKAYRHYKIFLNVNSIDDSESMLSRRIFELAASGTPIISSPSLAIDKLFPNKEIFTSIDPTEIRKEIQQLINNNDYWEEKSNNLIKAIQNRYTYKQFTDSILQKINYKE